MAMNIDTKPDTKAEEVDDSADVTPYDEGFTIKTVIGSLFVGLIMMPGAIYLGLVAGAGLGSAAQWVTIVLFAEIARRSFIPLKRQELFLLYYVAGGLASVALQDRGLSGGPFAGLIWNQYFIQSPQAAAIAKEIPWFVSPQPGSAALNNRTFMHADWGGPIMVLLLIQLLERLSWLPAGYLLFRQTSDIEKLPFPLAPVAAAGAMALDEGANKEESWRWRIFSTGTIMGLVFGLLYTAIPVITGVAFGKSATLLPIPFLDLMASTEKVLPASPMGISFNLTNILIGFVLPFEMVVGGFVTNMVTQLFANPMLYRAGMLPKWHEGTGAIQTSVSNSFDFWMSFGIGVQLAIAVIGITIAIKGLVKNIQGKNKEDRGAWSRVPAGRGDKPSWTKWAALMWFAATVVYIGVAHYLLPTFPLWLLVVYGLVWTPINSFISARMYGLTSGGVNFPFLQQVTIMKSGYHNIDVWFAPMPLHDYGYLSQRFREVELTRTKFTSIIKAELLMLPILLFFGFLYWQFIWHTSPIPSTQYPFVQKLWPIFATQQAIWTQINKSGGANWMLEAIKADRILAGGTFTMLLYGVMSLTKAPMLAFYGAVGGIGGMPADSIPTFIGACLGKYYFAKRFGLHNWRAYTPVLLAGFACGMGLTSMGAIAIALISKAVQPLPF
jgi:hypothetical protein